jgi:methylenetetrahydrofolate dehydrogenase (NADP+)/methenyltetrahydrofolate cyclohydrolase
MVIDGKDIAKKIQETLKQEIKEYGYTPSIAFILVGEDPASKAYVRMKGRACQEIGIRSIVSTLEKESKENELIELIQKYNSDDSIDGILCQMPLPKHISEQNILNAISPEKDVDGFHPVNIGKLTSGDSSGFIPCTPLGVLRLLEASNINPEGKEVVIVGRSSIVGRPLSILLSQKRPFGNATVTVAHSKTPKLSEVCKRADILISAVGSPKFITPEMVKPQAVVIDVGINRLDGGLVGDVDFDNVSKISGPITPVPGGVGPMTIAMLMENTLLSHKRRKI